MSDLQALLMMRSHLDQLVREGKITGAQRKGALLEFNSRIKALTAKVESLTPITHRPCGACNASVGPSEWEWLVTDSQTPLPASETPDSAAGTAHP